jgi:pimeloyl-ACP methyl ester carboxylesterase
LTPPTARPTLAVSDRVRDLDVPARVVWGAADQFQKIAYGERLAWDLRADLDRIEGGKHFVPEDHPERIAEAIHAVVRAA